MCRIKKNWKSLVSVEVRDGCAYSFKNYSQKLVPTKSHPISISPSFHFLSIYSNYNFREVICNFRNRDKRRLSTPRIDLRAIKREYSIRHVPTRSPCSHRIPRPSSLCRSVSLPPNSSPLSSPFPFPHPLFDTFRSFYGAQKFIRDRDTEKRKISTLDRDGK